MKDIKLFKKFNFWKKLSVYENAVPDLENLNILNTAESAFFSRDLDRSVPVPSPSRHRPVPRRSKSSNVLKRPKASLTVL